jgi:hypothetical protein
MNSPLKKLLQKEVTRKEFMVLLGSSALALIGLSAILPALTGKDNEGNIIAHHGYGSGRFKGPTE